MTYEEKGYVRQFHAHENPTHEERDGNTDECDTEQQDSIELRRSWLIGLVQQYEAHPAHHKQETRCKALHDELTVHTVLHERYLKCNQKQSSCFNMSTRLRFHYW